MNRRVQAGTIAVLSLLVLAGCFGIGGSPDTPAPGDTASETPVPDTAAESPTPYALRPPGVPDRTLQNVTALIEAHNESLVESGFVAEVRSGGKSLRYTLASEGAARSIESGDGTREIWTNGTLTLERRSEADGGTYSQPPESFLSPGAMTRRSRLRALLTVTGYERAGTTDCGASECVVLRAEGASSERYRNFSAVAHVDERGIVHTYRATYVRQEDETPVEYRFTVRSLGDVTVERPAWIGEALAELS